MPVQIFEGVAIGLVMGLLSAFWLMFSLFAIHRTLARGASIAAGLAALFTLPGFMGGGTWVTARLYAPLSQDVTLAAYFMTAALLIAVINAWPGYRIVKWCATHVGAHP
jgi:hypothetical protein